MASARFVAARDEREKRLARGVFLLSRDVRTRIEKRNKRKRVSLAQQAIAVRPHR
jgi:hypothetical protein